MILDFLKKIGFKSNSIGLHGISLGASTSIFAAHAEPEIRAVWAQCGQIVHLLNLI